MLCESILGKLSEKQFQNFIVDYVDIDWYEIHKKLHRKKTRSGKEIGILLDEHKHSEGLSQDDVLFCDGNTAVAVNIKQCAVIIFYIEDSSLLPKVCYEIGNKHAPLFFGEDTGQFLTVYDGPVLEMLEKLGVRAEIVTGQLDFSRCISGRCHMHTH